MERLRQNGGNFGIVAAVLLAVLFILVITSGLTPETTADPSKALPLILQMKALWTLTGLLGVMGSLFAVLFTVGLFSLFREKAPTRAYAVLLFGTLGSAGYALSSLGQWQGGALVAATKDQVAASYAWVAVNALVTSFNGFGNTFVGVALLVSGWAITATRALSSALGWVAYVAGILTLLGLFTANSAVFLLSFLLVIIWLAWAGFELRSAASMK